jgi:hypothetical protein
MPAVVGIQITDKRCLAAAPTDAARGVQTGILGLAPIRLKGPELEMGSEGGRIISIHTRLDPRAPGGGSIGEIFAAFRHLRESAGAGEKAIGVVAVPGAYTATQRELVRGHAHRAGFEGAAIVDASIAAALGTVSVLGERTKVFAVCAEMNSFTAGVVDVGRFVCRGDTLEVSSTCSIGGFWLALFRAFLDCAPPGSELRLRANRAAVSDLYKALLDLLRADDPRQPAQVSLKSWGSPIALTRASLEHRLQPVLDEFNTRIGEALGDRDPDCVHLSSDLARIPLLARAVAERVQGICVDSDESTVLRGAVRYGILFPPKLLDSPPPPQIDTKPRKGRAQEIREEIDDLEKQLRESPSDGTQVRRRLSEAYGRAAQMYRMTGDHLAAWDYAELAVQHDRENTEAVERHKDIAREYLQQKFSEGNLSEVVRFLADVKRLYPTDKLVRDAEDRHTFHLAEFYARRGNRGEAIRILKKLLARRPRYKAARDLLDALGGRRVRR